jgi:hypothetical protein
MPHSNDMPILRPLVLSLFCCVSCVVFTNAAVRAQGTPGPTIPEPTTAPQPAPKKAENARFHASGYLRSYYFTRTNNFAGQTPAGTLNQAAFNTGVNLHGTYDLGSGFSVGAAYFYANPFNGSCSLPAESRLPPCSHPARYNPSLLPYPTNPDNTLPDFRLSTLDEAYLRYAGKALTAVVGDQILNTPWANASDSRLKPVAFQGGDATYRLSPHLSVEAAYMDRFESRVDSNFVDSTLLTERAPADAPGAGGNIAIPGGNALTNDGFGMAHATFASGPVGANVYGYAFANIADALWIDGKYAFRGPGKPFIAIQAGTERDTGSALIGKIASQVVGGQVGISPWSNVDISFAYDDIPQKSDTVTLPAGVSCSTSQGSLDTVKTAAGVTFAYFLPAGGTPNCLKNGNGTATIYYGGWASPYTDSYATDPLFTTSISQGLIDRRSPGQGGKLAITVYSSDRRFRFIASRAYYAYGNGAAGVVPTQETDFDGTYFFNKVGKGAYRGFSLRHRFADRSEQFTNVYGGAPEFIYNRTQLEYDF